MSGFGDGYVGTAQDAVKIRRLEKQREAERRKIEEGYIKNNRIPCGNTTIGMIYIISTHSSLHVKHSSMQVRSLELISPAYQPW